MVIVTAGFVHISRIIISNDFRPIGDPFFDGVMKGIMQVANEMQYTIFIRETQLNTLTADEYSTMVLSKQADGIILLASICPFTPASFANENNQQPIIISCESVTPELSHFPLGRGLVLKELWALGTQVVNAHTLGPALDLCGPLSEQRVG